PTLAISPLSLHDALPISLDRGDGFEILQSHPRFDLEKHADFFAAALQIIGHATITIGSMQHRHSAQTARGITGGGHGGARFFGRDRKSTRLNSSHVAISY